MNAIDWKVRAAKIDLPSQAYIDGAFVDAASGTTFASINPANGQTLQHIAACDQEDVNRTVIAARKAFQSRLWSGQKPQYRRTILLQLAEAMETAKDDLALLECLGSGLIV